MKTSWIISGLALLVLSLGASAVLAKGMKPEPDVARNTIVLRQGPDANQKAGYANEESDMNGTLSEVSALCSAGPIARNRASTAVLAATDTTRNWFIAPPPPARAWGVTEARTILDLGGHVQMDPRPGNPRHCLISGLKAKDITGVWRMCPPGAGAC